jgi:hydrogenase maturation protease
VAIDSEKILVMGVGNPLMRDDGIGPRVIELLRTGYTFPDNVEVVDAGTMSFMILDLLRGVDRLIIIDAVDNTEEPPGTVLRMTPEEIAPNQVAHSLHDLKLVDVLQAADLMGSTPQTIAFGVQIEEIVEWVLELSTPVEAAVPIVAGAVLEELQTMGIEPLACEDADVHAQIIGALRSYAPMPDQSPDPG